MWREAQKQFAAALRDPSTPVPNAISKTADKTSTKRFNVYRNNIAVGLSDAIADAYPVVQALVGEAFFKGIARTFNRLFLPASPVMLDYGEDFPDFIATQSGTETLPYLGNVARLEWAWSRAYHAADATPTGIENLAAIPEDSIEGTRLQFHPSIRLLQSPWPIVSIWQAHQGQDPHGKLVPLPDQGEQAMIGRRGLNVEVRALDPVSFTFIKALHDGQTLGEASTLALGAGPQDLSTPIAALFESRAVVGVSRST